MMQFFSPALAAVAFGLVSHAYPVARNEDVLHLSSVGYGDLVFELGDVAYLALTTTPSASAGAFGLAGNVPFTVVKVEGCSLTEEVLGGTLSSYLETDDVLTDAFLQGIYVESLCEAGASISEDGASYLESLGAKLVLLHPSIELPASSAFKAKSAEGLSALEPGPYVAVGSGESTAFAQVYRLYQDRYRTFIFGAYPDLTVEGSYKAFPVNIAKYQDPLIPVPSRLYSLFDTRPFAGFRVGIKDLYDIKGLQTAGGSRAWASITPVTNTTAPVIQRIIELGGHPVGKQKTAQFASGADPWDWYDVQYPFNPRGDEWLTCSASSSGGGCSIAAYDWLDYAIGSDTGSSVRRPASVAGVYGNRPSQGMITLAGVQPLGAAQDTAGVFSRDPYAWASFAKHWYTPELVQDPSINGLEPLVVPESGGVLPTTILYTPDYLPARNPDADALVQQFVQNLGANLEMTIETVNITTMILESEIPAVRNTSIRNNASTLLNQYTQWVDVGRPLVDAWAQLYDGRFPPVDPARRPGWITRIQDNTTEEMYQAALGVKRSFSEWMNNDFLGQGYNTEGSDVTTADECANSGLWIYDIGTGGLPSYREEDLIVGNPAATYLNYTPPSTLATGVSFCSFAGCADFTVPIGEVPYFSNVTRSIEMVPVTLSLVMRRGCDYSLFDLITKMADVGMLKTVKTGRTAF